MFYSHFQQFEHDRVAARLEADLRTQQIQSQNEGKAPKGPGTSDPGVNKVGFYSA